MTDSKKNRNIGILIFDGVEEPVSVVIVVFEFIVAAIGVPIDAEVTSGPIGGSSGTRKRCFISIAESVVVVIEVLTIVGATVAIVVALGR